MQSSTSSQKIALALVGMAGSGKTVCASHLQAKGYFQFRFGKIVTDEVLQRGWALTPENERTVREEFRAHEGMDAIAKRALPHLQAALAAHDVIVIDGLYSFSEYKLLQVQLSARLVVVSVVTHRHLRYARLTERQERPLTVAQAQARDYSEIENMEKGGPIALADYTLLNNGTADELIHALDQLLQEVITR